jgi:anaerobic ribonucleoside-triphosphate reductase
VKRQDVYKETRIFIFPNMIARVHIPDLTKEERARRMAIIHDAAANLLKNHR